MTSWNAIKSHIHENFTVARSEEGRVQLEFGVGKGRTQVVFLTCHTTSSNDEWLVIESPFGRFGEIDVTAALSACEGILCGGIGIARGEFVTIRHAIPLANLDLNELAQPLALVTMAADEAESALSTRDAY